MLPEVVWVCISLGHVAPSWNICSEIPFTFTIEILRMLHADQLIVGSFDEIPSNVPGFSESPNAVTNEQYVQ